MNETALRQLLDHAMGDEPPPGPISQNSLRTGIKLRRRRRAVGAAGTVIVAACAAIIPAAIGTPGHTPGQAAGQPSAGLAGAPRFFAGVAESATVVNLYRSATGRVAGSIRPPGPYHVFTAVSRLGGDRTFVAAAITAWGPTACTSHLFRFNIDGQGHPSGLTPLSVPQVTGGQVAELASSADGKALAYTVSGCAPAPGQAIGMINLTTGRTTRWAVPHHGHQPVSFGSVSLTGDGSRLGFVVGSPVGAGLTNAYVLPTESPSGPLMRHARKVLHVPTGVFRVVLSNNGSQAYVETGSASHRGAVVLSEYSTTTGQQVRLLGQLRPGGRLRPTELSVTVDAAGKHLLAYSDTQRVTAVNLTTGHQAPVTAAEIPYLDAAYTTAAW